MLLNINIDKLSKLVESFYKLTKIRTVVYDDNFNEVFCYPENHSVFCEMMNSIPEIHNKCITSAGHLCSLCQQKKEMVCMTCHAGLTEVAFPLCEDNITIGYIMFGQITNIKNSEKFANQVRQRCNGYGLCAAEFDKKIKSIRYKSNEQIEAASEIMNAFTSYIYMKKIVSTKKEALLGKITSFIDNNLSSDLSVSAICEKISISKTVLYEITKQYMPGGIAKYVKTKRLEKAKVLLESSDKSVEEISGLAGFLDSNYFRRSFKAYTGMSAKQYRKKNSSN